MSDINMRKDQHLLLCLDPAKEVESGHTSGLSSYRLEYDALPELDLADVDLSVELLGRKLSAPLLLGAMTGGSANAAQINTRLARVAAKMQLGMALGSQRAMLQDPALTYTYDVREVAPDLPLLLGNIGAVQLNYGVTAEQIANMIHAVRADGLYFHLNPLQEAIQPEGDTRFAHLHDKLHQTIAELPFPCLIKEVGAGISQRTADKLANLPIAGIEASGVGGTSWARIEGYRAAPNSPLAQIGEELCGFGITTAQSIQNCRRAFTQRLVIASGGIRNAHDTAVALILGADAVAIARPTLLAADQSETQLELYLSKLLQALKIICFCTGSRDITQLRQTGIIQIPAL
jgi:isopentenyl-diphosphate delta-isomerase